MDLLTNALKGQLNSLNLIILVGIITYFFHLANRRRVAFALKLLFLILFILLSTNYLPGYLSARMESQYQPFDSGSYPHTGGRIFIHVLGGGYNLLKKMTTPLT